MSKNITWETLNSWIDFNWYCTTDKHWNIILNIIQYGVGFTSDYSWPTSAVPHTPRYPEDLQNEDATRTAWVLWIISCPLENCHQLHNYTLFCGVSDVCRDISGVFLCLHIYISHFSIACDVDHWHLVHSFCDLWWWHHEDLDFQCHQGEPIFFGGP